MATLKLQSRTTTLRLRPTQPTLKLRVARGVKGEKGDIGPAGGVTTVFTRTGDVVAVAGDYAASKITNDSGVAGTNVDDALDQLAADIATAGQVDSVNGQTGTVVLDPDDLDDTSTTNKFTDAADISKLAGIEALADVTDAGNVGSAIHGATGKTTPVDADELALIDSAASNVLKKLTWANLKATISTYLALGTAALKNTGTSGNNVPLMDGANTWSAKQTFSLSTAGSQPLLVQENDDSATSGPNFDIFKNSASPAASDSLGTFRFLGRNSTPATFAYGLINGNIGSPTASSETGFFKFFAYGGGSLLTLAQFGGNSSPGSVYFPGASTTASAANAFLNSGSSPTNELLRSTSSLAYKRDVEQLDSKYADALLSNARPIWYRSKCEADNPNWSWYGLAAEEVAEIDPRLVHWGYRDQDYDISIVPEKQTLGNGEEIEVKKEIRTLKKDAQLRPDAVQYERIVPLLMDVIKRMDARISALEVAKN